MARACQYGTVCTDKSATEEGERARHWIMLGEKVDRGNRQGWAWRRRSPFMSSSAIQRQQASTPLALAASARTCAPAQQATSAPLLWHVKRGGGGGGVMITWKILSLLQLCVFLICTRALRAVDINYRSWIAAFCKYAFFCWLHCLARTSRGNVLKEIQNGSRRQHKIPFDGGRTNRKSLFFPFFSLLLLHYVCTRHSYWLQFAHKVEFKRSET